MKPRHITEYNLNILPNLVWIVRDWSATPCFIDVTAATLYWKWSFEVKTILKKELQTASLGEYSSNWPRIPSLNYCGGRSESQGDTDAVSLRSECQGCMSVGMLLVIFVSKRVEPFRADHVERDAGHNHWTADAGRCYKKRFDRFVLPYRIT